MDELSLRYVDTSQGPVLCVLTELPWFPGTLKQRYIYLKEAYFSQS